MVPESEASTEKDEIYSSRPVYVPVLPLTKHELAVAMKGLATRQCSLGS